MASDEPIENGRIDPPSVEAAKLLGTVLAEARSNSALTRYAEVDLRAVDEIRAKLQADPEDRQATSWARQIAKTWSNRIGSSNFRHIRRVLDLLDNRA
jgi:hypothetical protein